LRLNFTAGCLTAAGRKTIGPRRFLRALLAASTRKPAALEGAFKVAERCGLRPGVLMS